MLDNLQMNLVNEWEKRIIIKTEEKERNRKVINLGGS